MTTFSTGQSDLSIERFESAVHVGPLELLIKEAHQASKRRRLGWLTFFIVAAAVAAVITSLVIPSKPSSQFGSAVNDAKAHTATATARALCHNVLGAQALNSEPMKMSTIRQFGYGPKDFHPAPNAFPGLDAHQVVGLCWTGSPDTGYRLYAVAPHYKPVRIEGVTGVGFKSTPLPGFIDIP